MAALKLKIRKKNGTDNVWIVSIHHPDGRSVQVGTVKAKTRAEAQIKALKLNKRKNAFSPLEKAIF